MSASIEKFINRHAKNADSAVALKEFFNNIMQPESPTQMSFDYAGLCEMLPLGVIVQDYEGQIVHYNKSAERILGISLASHSAKTYLDPAWQYLKEDGNVFPLEDHPVSMTLQTGQAQTDLILGILKPETPLFWIAISTRPILDMTGEKVVGCMSIFADMTGHRMNTDQAVSSCLETERIRILSDFVRDASHEFRTPLATIHSKLYLMVRKHEEIADSRDVIAINRHLDQINTLVDKLELLLKLDEPTRWTIGAVWLNPLVESIIDNYHYTYAGQIRLEADSPKYRVVASEELVITALKEVLDNAIQFSPDHQDIIIHLRSHEHYVMIDVIDQGEGMPDHVLARIDERFFRVDDTRTRRGFGLGFTIVKRILAIHTKYLKVHSKAGEGTTVTMAFNNNNILPKQKVT